MISLVQLLRESQDNPKAIILAGAPGAGKSSTLKDLNLKLKELNFDDFYKALLKKSGVTLNLKSLTRPEDSEARSKSSKASVDAREELKNAINNTIKNKKSFILDGTAASYNETFKLKQRLEEVGYDVFMLYVYADLEKALIQNQDRFETSGGKKRSLAPGIVMSNWLGITKNYDKYKNLFGNNFASVASTLKDEKLKDIESIIKKYLDPFKITGTKPKTPAEQARRDKQKAKEAAEIQNLLNDDGVKNIIDGSVSKEEAQSKIKQFLSR